jgi:ribosomal protein L11 methyltransferase
MYSLHLKCSPDEIDFLSGELWEAGTVGIRELEDGLIAGFETNGHRADLLKRFGGSWVQEDSTDWIEATHQAWPPRLIGDRIFLAAHWCADETPAGRVRVIHNPGLACGTGEHPCTQLALAALESANVSGKVVVDIGSGSALLAIAALRLGARTAVGVDLDEAALTAARENFELNGLPANLAVGSADCLREADVTISNISATVILSIADELLRIGGTLILTGFSDYELLAMQQTFGPGTVTENGEWRCLLLQPS